MKNLILILLLVSQESFAQALEKSMQKTLVIIGDSLTEGFGVARESAFPALMQEKVKDWKIINSGISGATTASAKGRVQWVLKIKPQVVMLILGANDGLRGLKISESQKNLDEAIELLKKNNVTVILGGLYMPPNYGKKYSDQFKDMYSKLAQKHKVRLVPFVLDKVAGNPKYNLTDGIHPNEEGHKIIAENVYNSIKDILK
jgi:acyl-CoA thioesterase-1